MHCFNHQLHVVVMHAMSLENALQAFFDVCVCVCVCVCDMRTGHLATVSVIVNSYDMVMQFLTETDSSGLHTELRIEAAGLLRTVQESYFKFTAVMVHKILVLLTVLQDEKTDLYTGMKDVKSVLDCAEKLRSVFEFQAPGGPHDASETATPPPSKRMHQVPTHLKQHVVESTVG